MPVHVGALKGTTVHMGGQITLVLVQAGGKGGGGNKVRVTKRR
jgi:hypothetical protein